MRKRTKRKVQYSLIDPIKYAIVGASITAKKDLDKLRLRELTSMESLRTGKGTKEDWRSVVDMMNISETMALSGIGAEVLPYVQILQKSMHEAAERYEKTGKMGLNGSGIVAMREVYEYHDLQRTSISRSEYEKMIKKTGDFIRSRHELVVQI
jgi:hypothetical protein